MKKLLIVLMCLALQSCGSYCGAQKFRNSNKYYGTTKSISHDTTDIV